MKSFPSSGFVTVLSILILTACSFPSGAPLDDSANSIPFPPTKSEGATGLPSGTQPPTDTVDLPGETPSDPHSQPLPLSPSPTSSLALTPIPCPSGHCADPGHFLFARPIAPPGRTWVDPTYRFGATQNGEREAHHGVEFVNSSGTPVLAAAGGTVVVAGNDRDTIYADWPAFYGDLVILEHEFDGLPEPVYTLYAHLSAVEVAVGEQVVPGQRIGQVGLSGVATGSHLHFEVRVGENRYRAVENPELWLAPQEDENGLPYGVLAGRIEDGNGQPVYIPNLVVERLSGPEGGTLWQHYLETYKDPRLIPAGGQGENFAIGDLPAGWYRLTFVYRGLQTREAAVIPGQVTWVTFTIP